MSDAFTSYETSLKRLLECLGSDEPRYAEVLVYQQRLQENIAQARKYGDTDALKHARAQIVDALNRLALEVAGVSFNELCESQESHAPVEHTRDIIIADSARLEPPFGGHLPKNLEPLGRSDWNTAAIRDLLTAAFSDEKLTTLCYDYFRPVYDNLAAGMSKGQKVQRLLDYCERHNRIPELLDRVRRANPSKYAEFELRLELRLEQPPEPDSPAPPAPTPPSGLQTGGDDDTGPVPDPFVPLSPLWILFSVIAALVLGLISNVLANMWQVNTLQRLFIAIGVFCLALATVLWVEFRQARVPIAGLSLLVTIALASIGALCLAGGLVCTIITTPSPAATATSIPMSSPILPPPDVSIPTPTPVDMPFYVYRDDASSDNHFSFWEGIWEDGDSIQIDCGYSNNCRSDSTCMRIAYTPIRPQYRVGINWLHPRGNQGAISEGFNLRKATRLTFWARGEEGGEIVAFDMGGLGRDADTCAPTAPYPDSVCPTVWITRELSADWRQHSIDLAGKDLSHVIRGFFVSIGGASDRTIYLDEIRYENGPLAPLTTTAMLTPIPDCRGVQVSHLELDLIPPTGQEVYPDEKGVITLTHDAIRGLVNLSGQAILTGTNAADCTCYWKGKTDGDSSWQPINSLTEDCAFSIDLPDEVMAIQLVLTVGGDSGPTTIFIVRVR